jgi:AraC-like DNA-binding protein
MKNRRSSHRASVLWVAQYDYRPGHVLTEHEHSDFWQMILVLSGDGSIRLAGRERAIAARDLYFLAPQVQHGLRSGRKPLRTLDVKFLVANRALGKQCLRIPTLIERADARFVRPLKELLDEALAAKPYHLELCNLKLEELLLQLLRQTSLTEPNPPGTEPPTPDERDPLVRRVLEFVQRNYDQNVSSSDLARAARLSYRQLGDHFQAAMGTSPVRYLSNYRIERAKDLLRFSDYELKQIAKLVGFKTVHHFTRVFHETCKLSPGRWRDEQVRKIGSGVTLAQGFVNTFRNVTR